VKNNSGGNDEVKLKAKNIGGSIRKWRNMKKCQKKIMKWRQRSNSGEIMASATSGGGSDNGGAGGKWRNRGKRKSVKISGNENDV
jgi:hypothetical protein